jgi:hypothetical protein
MRQPGCQGSKVTSRAAVGSAALFFGEGPNEGFQQFGFEPGEKIVAYDSEHNKKYLQR